MLFVLLFSRRVASQSRKTVQGLLHCPSTEAIKTYFFSNSLRLSFAEVVTGIKFSVDCKNLISVGGDG